MLWDPQGITVCWSNMINENFGCQNVIWWWQIKQRNMNLVFMWGNAPNTQISEQTDQQDTHWAKKRNKACRVLYGQLNDSADYAKGSSVDLEESNYVPKTTAWPTGSDITSPSPFTVQYFLSDLAAFTVLPDSEKRALCKESSFQVHTPFHFQIDNRAIHGLEVLQSHKWNTTKQFNHINWRLDWGRNVHWLLTSLHVSGLTNIASCTFPVQVVMADLWRQTLKRDTYSRMYR